MGSEQDRTTHYQEGSLTLPGTVMLGTGVMIGAGIFALTGQMAQMTGVLFPWRSWPPQSSWPSVRIPEEIREHEGTHVHHHQ